MTHLDSQRTDPPPRLAVDGRGFVWRVYNDGHWSMAPSNPDNSPIPEPITYYEEIEPPSKCATCGSPKLARDSIAPNIHRLVCVRNPAHQVAE